MDQDKWKKLIPNANNYSWYLIIVPALFIVITGLIYAFWSMLIFLSVISIITGGMICSWKNNREE